MSSKIFITDEQKKRYRDEGYFVLENAISEEQLNAMRSECDYLIKEQEAEMDKQGTDILGLSKRNSRYFVFNAYNLNNS